MKETKAMRIKQIIIYGYGKWIDQTFDISSQFHVFLGKNEAGKSTLMSFIHSVLFGFPTRQSLKLRYEPKNSSRYGGKIIIQDERFGLVSIERTSGKATGEVSVLLEDGSTGSEKLLKDILYGLEFDLYRNLFSFQLKDLEEVKDLTRDKFHRFFLSIGALGSKEFLKQADQFSKNANTLYKPTGRVPKINKKVGVLEEKQEILNQVKEKNGYYLEMVQQVDVIEKELVRMETDRDQLNERIDTVQQIEKGWNITEEIRMIEKEIAQIKLVDLPEEGLFELNRLNQEIEAIRKAIHQVQEKVQEYREEHQPSKIFVKYQENEKKIENVKDQIPFLMEKLREKLYIEKEKERLKQHIMKEKIQEGLKLGEVLPRKWSLEEQKHVEKWTNQFFDLEKQLKEVEQELLTLSYKLTSHMDRIDQLEENLWSNDRFREETTYHESHIEKRVEKNNYSKEIIGLVIGGVSFLSSFLINHPISWVVGIFGICICLMSSVLLYKKRAEKSSVSDHQHYSYEALIQQKEIRKQWRHQLADVDVLEEEKNSILNKKEQLEYKIKQLNIEWTDFKRTHYIPESVELNEALTKQEHYQELQNTQLEMEELEESLIGLTESVELILLPIKFLDELFPMSEGIERKVEMFNHFLQKIKDEKRNLQQYISDSREVEREQNRLIKQEKQKLQEKQQLLKSVEADSEDVFRHLYDQLSTQESKKEQVKLLKAQQNLEESSFFNSLDEVQKEKQSLNLEKQQLLKSEKEMTTKKIQLELDIKKLEEGGEYTDLLQDFENEKSDLQALVDEWAVNRVAAFLIESTLNYSMEDRLPKTLKEAELYFAFLTNQKYNKIVVDHQIIRVLSEDGKYYEVNELSRGTAEPLYVALRLAFVNNMKDILRLPIIIDDGFVNFDDERKEKVYRLLNDISHQTQVLYFSFDEEVLEMTDKEQVTMLQ